MLATVHPKVSNAGRIYEANVEFVGADPRKEWRPAKEQYATDVVPADFSYDAHWSKKDCWSINDDRGHEGGAALGR